MKEIQLTKGYVALVDDADFDELSKYVWRSNKVRNKVYAYRTIRRGLNISMHRQLAGASVYAQKIDHKNGNGLDNQRENLRICTNAQNLANKGIGKSNKSGYKGVSYDPRRNKWFTCIGKIKLGRFSTIEDGARHYNKAAVERWGEFAYLNDVHPLFP